MQKQESKKDIKLTPTRAQLLYALFGFESLGEFSSLFAANKLAYFLQRMGEDLKLQFTPHHYGPYAIGVEKVLYHLSGVYLKGMEQGEAKPFESLNLNYYKWAEVEKYVADELDTTRQARIKNLFKLIGNFSSELSLEILASTDFILAENPNYTLDEVANAVGKWSNRKNNLFKREHIEIAYDHLMENKHLFVEKI